VFSIVNQQKQYQTYILTDEQAQAQIEVVPARGAIITSWRIQNQDILYLDAERFANQQLSVRGGIPILFPICGNLPDNTYTYQDRQYQLKQHGFARDLPWEVTATETDKCASITLSLNSSEQTLAVYPFAFELTFTYQLQGNSLKIIQNYTNKSQVAMPFNSGLHPYFLIKDKNQLDFDIPASEYQDQISQEISHFSGKFDFEQEEIDVVFRNISKHTTALSDRQENYRISISYSDLYSTLVFWTVKGKDYVCLEPWSAPRNSLNTGEKLTYVQPETTYQSVVTMNFSFL
jgi:galactose mutarotase-like enzyme